jgi:hypothetical protein
MSQWEKEAAGRGGSHKMQGTQEMVSPQQLALQTPEWGMAAKAGPSELQKTPATGIEPTKGPQEKKL